MDATPRNANSATPNDRFGPAVYGSDAMDEDDLALGWECANPALQIESWSSEAATPPLQRAY